MGFLTTLHAQFEPYKYIIVPTQFEDFTKENQHQTSTLLKHLLTQREFNVVYENNLPEELRKNRCLGLKAELNNDSSLFTIKVNVVMTDCNDQVVFATEQGRSKLKEFKPGYAEAMRRSLRSLDGISHNYSPKKAEQMETEEMVEVETKTSNTTKDVSEATIAETKTAKKVVEEKIEETPMMETSMKEKEVVEKKMKETATMEVSEKEKEIVEEKKEETSMMETSVKEEIVAEKGLLLYAQEIPNGFQLVDSTPKIVLRIFKTSVADHFIATSDDKSGVVYKKGAIWIYEFYENGEQVKQQLTIKF